MTNNFQNNQSELEKLKAVELIRQKVSRIYQTSPSAIDEEEVIKTSPNNSPHQDYVKNLLATETNIASIQTKWHDYYLSLPDEEKFQVWQEFYDSNNKRKEHKHTGPNDLVSNKTSILEGRQNSLDKFSSNNISLADKKNIKQEIILRASDQKSNSKVNFKDHLKSLFFGLSVGFLTLFIFLFGFFNQVIITPFIQPSTTDSATPLILTGSNVAPTNSPEIIIPKINVQIPVIYSVTSNSESVIENNLENGVVHYPSTLMPGQIGNSAFFGHSSNNILNPGRYKFAFVLLHTLVNGDTFYLTYNGTVYAYKVISHNIVPPNDVSVLGSVPGYDATATLITCDPPGTSINRLVVVGEQISPNPSGNVAANPLLTSYQNPTTLPGNGPSLFSKVFSSLTNRIVGIAILVIFLLAAIKWLYSFKN